MDITVEPLSNYPGAIPLVAEWHFTEWGHTDPGGSLDSWTSGMARQAGAESIPGTLIAVADGTPLGVVCLTAQDMPGYQPAASLTPWLKGLYVAPAARRQGIGTALIRRCEAWAASLGYPTLYLYTERDSPAESLYRDLNWQPVQAARYNGISVTVMQTTLT